MSGAWGLARQLSLRLLGRRRVARIANPKIHGDWAGEAPGVAKRSREVRAAGSGGGLKGDVVAERFQLADVVALDRFGASSLVVEVGAQVVEVGLLLGQ